jgi:hypothetical protein
MARIFPSALQRGRYFIPQSVAMVIRSLRQLANRWVGILHGCLKHGTTYDEHTAWNHILNTAAR